MKLLQLNQISDRGIESLKKTFNDLSETSHEDGKYRLRRYSVVEVHTTFWNAKTEAEISRLSQRDFLQNEELNTHQGGVIRSFDEISDDALQSDGMKETLLAFKEGSNFINGTEVEIHQMRIVSSGVTLTCPEGVHQDGFKNIAILGVDRFNIVDGNFQVMESKDGKPIVDKALEDGNMAMLRDDILWHYAKPIVSVDTNKQGHWDAFVFCANKLS